MSKQIVTNGGGQVDLTGSARSDVGRQQTLPEHAQVLDPRGVDDDGRAWQLTSEFLVGFSVSACFHGELEVLQAVILREIGHEGTERIGRRGSVSQHLVQRRPG